MVTDLRKVNKNLKSHIVKCLEPDDVLFASVDMSSGYHQVSIHPDSRDIFSGILPAGKFRFTTLP